MNKKYKLYIKLNLMSVFFIVVSFISATLAWFAYSGLSNLSTDIDVKAWYIELEKNGSKVSNDIVISLNEVYPGMKTVHEVISIKNKGDSNATVDYSLVSARILGDSKDNFVVNDTTVTSDYVEDLLSHSYPFKINISLLNDRIQSKDGVTSFEVSISWPLDSGNDELDSVWGVNAYNFVKEEQNKYALDSNYQVRSPLKVVISLTAEQDLKETERTYEFGDLILYNPIDNIECNNIEGNCISTYVINRDDNKLYLLPNPKNTLQISSISEYQSTYSTITSNWTSEHRPLKAEDILKLISTDINDSILHRPNLSDRIIGTVSYQNRAEQEILLSKNQSGYYTFNNTRFQFLSSADCYWTDTEYNSNLSFALKRENTDMSKMYGELKTQQCNVIPVIVVNI